MNIFFLDTDPVKAAQLHVDKHVNKMIVESAQLLSTYLKHKGLGLDDDVLYKYTKTWVKHPSSLWLQESVGNARWLVKMAKQLCREREERELGNFQKPHKTEAVLDHIEETYLTKYSPCLEDKGLTPMFSPAVDTESNGQSLLLFGSDDVNHFQLCVLTYRLYYLNSKRELFSWGGSNRLPTCLFVLQMYICSLETYERMVRAGSDWHDPKQMERFQEELNQSKLNILNQIQYAEV